MFRSIHKLYTSVPCPLVMISGVTLCDLLWVHTIQRQTNCRAHNSCPENWPFGTNQMGPKPCTIHIFLADIFTFSKSLLGWRWSVYTAMLKGWTTTLIICQNIQSHGTIKKTLLCFYIPIPHFHNPWTFSKTEEMCKHGRTPRPSWIVGGGASWIRGELNKKINKFCKAQILSTV